jgi:hypothetical protein
MKMLMKNESWFNVDCRRHAMGIGANNAIFSASDALLWRGLPGPITPDSSP